MEASQTTLVGRTERATVMNELQYTADWAQKLLRNLRMAYASMLYCSSMGGPNHDYGENGPDTSMVDSLICHLNGTLDQLNHKFDMHCYMKENSPAIWQSLQKTFDEFKHQGMGILPIPVNDKKFTAKPTSEVSKTDTAMFARLISELIMVQDKLQKILNKYYEKELPTFPHLQIQVKVVDAEGVDVITPDFDIEKIVQGIMLKKIDEKKSTPQEPVKPCKCHEHGEHECTCEKGKE